jgi:hypothetical protein
MPRTLQTARKKGSSSYRGQRWMTVTYVVHLHYLNGNSKRIQVDFDSGPEYQEFLDCGA